MSEIYKLKTTDVITIYGMRGSGKSVLGKYILSKYPRYIIFDPLGEYSGFGKVVYNLEDIDPVNDTKIVFNPRDTPNDETTHDLVSKYVWDYLPNYLFVTDEMHMYQPTGALTRNFKKVITQGRHRGIGLISISQRYANVNQTITTQSSHIFIFKLMGRDIETSKTYFGKDIELKLRLLPKYHYLYWNTSTSDFTLMKPIDDKIVKHIDKLERQYTATGEKRED